MFLRAEYHPFMQLDFHKLVFHLQQMVTYVETQNTFGNITNFAVCDDNLVSAHPYLVCTEFSVKVRNAPRHLKCQLISKFSIV